MKRRSKSNSRKLKITHTVIVPKWQKDLKAGVRGLKRNVWNVCAGVGLLWIVIEGAKFLMKLARG